MEQAAALAADLAGGKLTLNEWLLQMRKIIKEAYIAEYSLAVGGIGNLTQSDYGRIGAMLKKQYQYLQNFAEDIAKGNLSQAQIAYRAKMYIDSSTQAFERANAIIQGVPHLPAYPGDGQTACRANCRCHWEIEKTDGGYNCYWRLGVAEHCDDCVANAAAWNPLFLAG
jgi:hypothetical protein